MVKIKRVYDPALPDDGRRILVDRLWPSFLFAAKDIEHNNAVVLKEVVE